MLCLITLILSIGHSPATDAKAAGQDLITLAPVDQPFTRYLSMYNIPPEQREEYYLLMCFWLNSLSRARDISRPWRIGETLIRLDVRWYEWDLTDWEQLAAEEPYFLDGNIDPVSLKGIKEITKSVMPVVRADFFLSRTVKAPYYNLFLNLPKTLAELKAQFVVQEDAVIHYDLDTWGAVLNSIVAHNNRQLVRLPTIFGYFWFTLDAETSRDGQAVLDNLNGIKFDGSEILGSLANKLQYGALSDKNGNLVAVVPTKIAVDTRTPYKFTDVVNYRSCAHCHPSGINTFSSVVQDAIKQQILTLKSYDYEKAQRLERIWLTDIPRQIERDSSDFLAALKECNGWGGEQNAAIFIKACHKYDEGRIDLVTAARECGTTPERFEKVLRKEYRGTALILLSKPPVENTIARDAWESIFSVVSLRVVEAGYGRDEIDESPRPKPAVPVEEMKNGKSDSGYGSWRVPLFDDLLSGNNEFLPGSSIVFLLLSAAYFRSCGTPGGCSGLWV